MAYLPSQPSIQRRKKNSLICCVAAKLHNFVIDNDNIKYKATCNAAELRIDPIFGGTGVSIYNRGYLAPLPPAEKEMSGEERRAAILRELTTREMKRPTTNLIRNQELDAVSLHDKETAYEFDATNLNENFETADI